MSSAQVTAAAIDMRSADAVYYQDSPHFVGVRDRVIPQRRSLSNARFIADSDDIPKRLIADFNQPRIENVGRLTGDYAVLNVVETAGTYLFDRSGDCVKINYAREEEWAKRRDNYCLTDAFRANRDMVLGEWDRLPVLGSMPILSTQNHHNYYHFIFDLFGKLAHFDEKETREFAVSAGMVQLPFQKSIVTRMMGPRGMYALPCSVRVVDPLVASTSFTDVGFDWLRAAAKFEKVESNRRVYVRRTTSTWGRTGGIVEDDDFLRFLRDFRFDIVDFRLGDLSFEQQVGLISGARVVLMSHSSALANALFLDTPTSVVEILGTRWAWKPMLELAMARGFKYYGVVEPRYDAAGDIIVDCERLRQVMRWIEEE